MKSVMVGLIPMAGTMTSFGAIKSAIQQPKNCTKAEPTIVEAQPPINVSAEAKEG